MGINPLKLMQLKDAWMQFNPPAPEAGAVFPGHPGQSVKRRHRN